MGGRQVDLMLARPVSSLPAGPGWAFEPKLDGFRCCLSVTAQGAVRLESRRRRPLTRYFPELVEAAAGLPPGVVLDGELVVPRGGGVDFTALQTRLHPSQRRAARLARETPAALVAFDLLADHRHDLRAHAYDDRRAALTDLLCGAPAGLGVMPMTTDAAAAAAWLAGQPAGVEGVVAKRRGQAYRRGMRAWRKLRTRTASEAVIGGVLGPLRRPTVLILGRYDDSGRLRVAGRSRSLGPAARDELGAVLSPPFHPHPWPATLPSSRFGQIGGARVVYTPAAPFLVAEVEADLAFEHGRWRHPVTYRRLRPDIPLHEVVDSS